jgi:hypothetical protein
MRLRRVFACFVLAFGLFLLIFGGLIVYEANNEYESALREHSCGYYGEEEMGEEIVLAVAYWFGMGLMGIGFILLLVFMFLF